jgi:hypothetical protein
VTLRQDKATPSIENNRIRGLGNLTRHTFRRWTTYLSEDGLITALFSISSGPTFGPPYVVIWLVKRSIQDWAM